MKLILVDRDPIVCAALRSVIPEADVRNTDLANVPDEDFDVLFTPGNSFGFMDGGFDLAVRNRYPGAEPEIQAIIKQFYYGMLAVGQAFVAFNNIGKAIAYAPTMRVPEPIVNTDNVYWAFRAALMATRAWAETSQVRHPNGKPKPLSEVRILSSAFGTSAGHMSAWHAAHSMRLAFEHMQRTPEQVEQAHTWQGAYNDHVKIRACR
jgi:hypothetical protein